MIRVTNMEVGWVMTELGYTADKNVVKHLILLYAFHYKPYKWPKLLESLTVDTFRWNF